MRTRAQDTCSGLEALTPAMWLYTSPSRRQQHRGRRGRRRRRLGLGSWLTTSSFKALTSLFHLFVPQLADLQDGGDNIINFTVAIKQQEKFCQSSRLRANKGRLPPPLSQVTSPVCPAPCDNGTADCNKPPFSLLKSELRARTGSHTAPHSRACDPERFRTSAE